VSRKNISDFTGNKDRAVVRELRAAGKTYSDSWKKQMYPGMASTSSIVSYDFNSGKTPVNYKSYCYEEHKPLPLPGTDKVIYGGSCTNPVVKDADVYVGFEMGMLRTSRGYPWNGAREVLFKIQDMSVPQDVPNFRKLVEWVKDHLDAGRKVHVGCLGGHGRTGMFLAALVSLYGEPDAITYVREHYCKKAVESSQQVEFLKKEYGVTPVQAAKVIYGKSYSHSGSQGVSSNSRPSTKNRLFKAIGGRSVW